MAKFEVPESNDSPDLTPMIDVVFLLIVFFMVVAQQVSEQYVELSDPKLGIASNAKVPESPPSGVDRLCCKCDTSKLTRIQISSPSKEAAMP